MLSAMMSLGLAMLAAAPADRPTPPVAPQVPHVETRFGEQVQDPWFWLREKQNPKVIEYLKAENAYTEALTAPQKDLEAALYNEFLGRVKKADSTAPALDGAFYYYQRIEADWQYHCLARRPAAPGGGYDPAQPEQILLDVNAMAKGHAFLGLGQTQVSGDGTLLLYSTDYSGYRQYDLAVRDLATGKDLGDKHARATSAAWCQDSRTYFFTTEDPETKRSDKLWRAKVGGPAELVYEEKDALFQIGVGRTLDRRYIVLGIQSTDTWECRLLDARAPEQAPRLVLPRSKGHKYEVDHRDGLLYIRTNRDAKDFRIVTAPVADPGAWQPFVAARPGVLVENIRVHKDFAVVQERTLGLAQFKVYDFAAGAWHPVAFPEEVYTAMLSGGQPYESRMFRFAYTSMTTPMSSFDYDPFARKRTLVKQQEVPGYDPSRYRTRRIWATAKDGVKVPISLVHRKGLARDGKAPLMLYGYGSYGYGQNPGFAQTWVSLLDRGGVFAIAHIRGGNELGEGWHDDGMLMKKKNTFTDFIACAEHLVAQKWTAKKRMAASGGSAGGLLMGAVVNLRPDLFRAIHSAVPFVDVINTMFDTSLPLTVGEYLEWGNPNEKAAYDYMRSYSPYDNLARKAYPAMLLTSSFNDSQVMYWEPTKYVAKLRTLNTGKGDLLLKMRMEAGGHGGASGRFDALKDRAFQMAWVFRQIGLTR